MDSDPYGLREMSNRELYEWTAGWKVGTEKHLAGQEEIIRRRDRSSNRRSWFAIGISAGSLLVALAALLLG